MLVAPPNRPNGPSMVTPAMRGPPGHGNGEAVDEFIFKKKNIVGIKYDMYWNIYIYTYVRIYISYHILYHTVSSTIIKNMFIWV